MAAGRIPDETIRAIRDRIDLADLIGRYVTLKQVGRNWKGLCPFHQEKTPSFHVHVERQIFHCFGCHAGGDAFKFLTLHDSTSFPDAVRMLARECGIEVPEAGPASDRSVVEPLYAANETAQAYYRACLAEERGAEARAYLAKRGYDGEAATAAGIGFAPDLWDGTRGALAAAKISADVGERAGLLAPRQSGGHYDRLRGRLIFPIRDARGRIVAFGGRALGPDQEPKYLNTTESPVYRKRESFYGLPDSLDPIRRQGRAVVVEGYFDQLALRRAAVGEALATCGTALTPEHAVALRRRTRNVVLLFDGDAAGHRAMVSALEVLLPHSLRVFAAVLPEGDDPDSFLVRHGAPALQALVDGAPPALGMAIRRAVSSGASTPFEKADAVEAAGRLIALVPDPVERAEFSRQLSMAANADPGSVQEVVAAAAPRASEPSAEAKPPARERPGTTPSEERWLRGLAQALLAHPELGGGIDRDELEDLMGDGATAALVRAIVDASAGGQRPDVVALAERLEGEAAAELRGLAVSGAADSEAPEAQRVIDDTLARLRRAKHKRESSALTQQLREAPADDAAALLALKDRQIKERGVPHRAPLDATT